MDGKAFLERIKAIQSETFLVHVNSEEAKSALCWVLAVHPDLTEPKQNVLAARYAAHRIMDRGFLVEEFRELLQELGLAKPVVAPPP